MTKIIVNTKVKKTVKFSKLKVGDSFKYPNINNNYYYIKVNKNLSTDLNAVEFYVENVEATRMVCINNNNDDVQIINTNINFDV